MNEEERKKLTQLVKCRAASVRLARRAQILLLASAGKQNEAIAEALGIGRVQAGRWRERYAEGGLAAIERDLPHGGRPPKVDAEKVGVSDTTVLRVGHSNGFNPHLVETFKVSRDPRFVETLEDIVGLYLNLPRNTRWCCAATKRAKCKHSIARSQACR